MNQIYCKGMTALGILAGFSLGACSPEAATPEGVASSGVVTTPSSPAIAPPAGFDSLDVLKVIPENYTLLLENEHVRVIEARIPPGTTEPPHAHLSGVSIAMGDYLIEHLTPSGEWTPSQKREPGTVYWSEGSVHQVRNVGTTPSHTIRIELKR